MRYSSTVPLEIPSLYCMVATCMTTQALTCFAFTRLYKFGLVLWSVKTKEEEKIISTSCIKSKPCTPLISLNSFQRSKQTKLLGIPGTYSKRLILEPGSLMDQFMSSMVKRCGQILVKLIKHKARRGGICDCNLCLWIHWPCETRN